MTKAGCKPWLLLAMLARGIASAMSMQDPATDFAFLEFEPYPRFGGERLSGPAVAPSSQGRAWRLAGQLSFPAGKAGDCQFFGSFKSTLMDRDIIYANQVLNDGILQRYWLSGGATWPGPQGQSTLVLAGAGLNSDFADLSPYDFNTEWIASHFWTPSASFNWGLGLDVQQYFRKFQPYPLFFADWKVTDRTKLKWDADFLEMRRFLSPWLCFTAGVRFNLEFFALKDNADFEYNSMGLETGFQYAVGGDFYARIKYKELVWGEETLGLADGSHHTRAMDAGRSLRLNLAYGL
jgi:hypothetical protein